MSGPTRSGRYAHLRIPRSMHYDTAPQVVGYLAGMIEGELNHGMPVRRRMGRVMAAAGRRGVPTGLLGVALRLRPRHPKPELDTLLRAVEEGWPELTARSDRLPATPPALRGILVQRTSVDMAFVFGEGPWPLLVAKKVASGVPDDGLRRERQALERVSEVRVGPRHLGLLGDVWVQEALPGLPMTLTAVDERNAATLTRPAAFTELDEVLARVAAHTSERAPLSAYDGEMLERATRHPLPADVAATVDRARRHVAGTRTTVVQHGDLLAQNWIVHEGRFSGLVDWETCLLQGLPGSDLVEAAVSAFEHGIALRAWSEPLLVELFTQAWASSPYFAQTRASLVGAVEAAGLRSADAEPLLVAYFAHRLGRHLTRPDDVGVGSQALAGLLTQVCRSLG